MPSRWLTAAAVTATALLVGACGGSGTTGPTAAGPVSTLPSIDGSPPPAAPAPAPPAGPGGSAAPATGKSVLPDLVVDDVAAGAKVNLASLAPGAEPLLVWFWAPH